jgi:N-methylhydantoinase A/oxoprolinase/acetone carboxylase beta subunit
MLMETLDAVRPELKLAQQFKVQTIPLDTMKAVNSRGGLIKDFKYRPSRQRKISYRVGEMNKAQLNAYYRAIEHKDYEMPGLSDAEKSDVIETAYQFVQYQYVAHKTELSDYRKQSFQALTARISLKKMAEFGFERRKIALESHDAMRATLGVGFRNGEAFQEISYRPGIIR